MLIILQTLLESQAQSPERKYGTGPESNSRSLELQSDTAATPFGVNLLSTSLLKQLEVNNSPEINCLNISTCYCCSCFPDKYNQNDILLLQPKRVKFTNCSQYLSHNFFDSDFHFYVIFLLIGIGQLDNDVIKSAHPKISTHSASQRAPLNLNVNNLTVMKYTCTYKISYKTEIFKSFYSMHFYLDLLLIK